MPAPLPSQRANDFQTLEQAVKCLGRAVSCWLTKDRPNCLAQAQLANRFLQEFLQCQAPPTPPKRRR